MKVRKYGKQAPDSPFWGCINVNVLSFTHTKTIRSRLQISFLMWKTSCKVSTLADVESY